MPLTLQPGYQFPTAFMSMAPMGHAQAPGSFGLGGDFMSNAMAMPGARAYTGQFAPELQRGVPMQQQQQQQQQYQMQQMQLRANPPPRVVEAAQQPVQQQPSPSKSLKRENEQLRQQLDAAVEEITRLQNDLSSMIAENATLRQQRLTPPASQSSEENVRDVPVGNSSGIRQSTSRVSTSAYGRSSMMGSRSNNSLSQSRSGTLTSGRPAWKGSGAHNAPLSFGANVRQLFGPCGTMTLAVTRVAQNGPAAGILREGDILEECEFVAPKEKDAENNQTTRIRRLSGCGFSKSALQKTLNTFNSGDNVTFSVNRNGERFESKVTLTTAGKSETPDRTTPVDSSLLDQSGDDDTFGPRMQELAEVNTTTLSNQLSEDDLSKLQNMNFDKLLMFCISEAIRHFGDGVAADEPAMAILTQAVRACENQLKTEGRGDVRAKDLYQGKDLVLHITGQQCFENGFVQEQVPISMAF